MKRTKSVRFLIHMALAAVVILALASAGCRQGAQRGPTAGIETPPSFPDVSLRELKDKIMNRAANLYSLKADCTATISNPLISRDPPLIQMSGKLVLKKPKKISLTLGRAAADYVKLVGDGNEYLVNMPVFGNIQYYGKYGDDLKSRRRRIHFLPDDLADALDQNDLFAGKTQILRTIYGVWHIDSVRLNPDRVEAPLQVVNSIVVDRSEDRLTQFDKYDDEGSLRVRFSFLQTRFVPLGPTGRLPVPSVIVVWYPIDNTTIYIRLSDIKVNEEVSDELFRLRE